MTFCEFALHVCLAMLDAKDTRIQTLERQNQCLLHNLADATQEIDQLRKRLDAQDAEPPANTLRTDKPSPGGGSAKEEWQPVGSNPSG